MKICFYVFSKSFIVSACVGLDSLRVHFYIWYEVRVQTLFFFFVHRYSLFPAEVIELWSYSSHGFAVATANWYRVCPLCFTFHAFSPHSEGYAEPAFGGHLPNKEVGCGYLDNFPISLPTYVIGIGAEPTPNYFSLWFSTRYGWGWGVLRWVSLLKTSSNSLYSDYQ